MLLFWPCAWGLSLAYDFKESLNDYFFYLTLFFLGSVLMRSAGCIVNDILDREFDKKVFEYIHHLHLTEKTTKDLSFEGKYLPISPNDADPNICLLYTSDAADE